jgi:integrase/recombinase XerD
MLNWYRQGKNVDQEMLKLITYLGHQALPYTYWYMEAVPELLALASKQAESHIAKEVQS